MSDLEICRKCYAACDGDQEKFLALIEQSQGSSRLWQAADWCWYNWRF